MLLVGHLHFITTHASVEAFNLPTPSSTVRVYALGLVLVAIPNLWLPPNLPLLLCLYVCWGWGGGFHYDVPLEVPHAGGVQDCIIALQRLPTLPVL